MITWIVGDESKINENATPCRRRQTAEWEMTTTNMVGEVDPSCNPVDLMAQVSYFRFP